MINKAKSTKKKPYLTTTDGVGKTGMDTVFCIGVSMRTGEYVPYPEYTRFIGRGNPYGLDCYHDKGNAEKACKKLNTAKEGRE